MANTTIDKPSDYFNTILYTGDGTAIGSGGQSQTGVGFQSDFTWIKCTNNTDNHALTDSVRGVTKILKADNNDAEQTISETLTAFGSDGFTTGNNSKMGASGRTYAAWNWKAGTSFSNDASATGIGSIDSAGSVNTDAGFSIVSYTGTGSVGTVAHGIDTPKMILFKNRTTASNWLVYHEAIGNTHNLYLDAVNGKGDRSDTFNDTSPTSSVFTVGTADLNTSGNSIIAYCFADVQGYSKVSGSYIGNGNVDGTFVYTGFKPAWLMVKSTATNNWNMLDNKRSPFNLMNQPIYADLDQGQESSDRFDFLSNGIKMRTTNTAVNGSGQEYIYMAFAENPFVTSTGIPTTAK